MMAGGCSSSTNNNNNPTPTVDGGDAGDGGVLGDGGQPDQTVAAQCTTPTFTPAPDGGALAAGTNVTVAAAGLPANGFIFYTTDGTLPTHGSKAVMSGSTIPITGTETIHALAFATGACSDSAVATATYTELSSPDAGDAGVEAATPQCGAPTFVPNGGAVTIGSTITITPPAGFPTNFPAGNAFVYYTTNGQVPDHTSPAYSGPIQVNTNESIRAVAYYPGVCTDSAVTLANFTVTGADGGVLVPPAFNPTATTRNNDFLVSLTESGNPAATICFTIGAGTTAPTPTCTVTATSATCTGTSQTYNAGAGLGTTGSVTINGGVTDATGDVTVNAIACAPGNATTTPLPQQYKLQVAAPTMQGPAPSATALPWLLGGYNPTLATATTGASLRYNSYVTGTAPALDCTTGTLLASPILAQPLNPGPLPVTTNITYQGVGCKPGYAPSAVQPFGYQIVLATPSFFDSTTTTLAEGTGTYDRAFSVNVTGTGPTGTYGCYTTDGSAPGCGATAGACATGSTSTTATPNIAISKTGTVVNAIECAANINASPAATAAYTLQLDPPGLDSPGCVNPTAAAPMISACTATGATTPILSYSIPANVVGSFAPNIEESLGSPPPSAAANSQPNYQFACVMKGGTPVCSPTGCAAGTILSGAFQTGVSIGHVAAGDSWSVIGCPGTAAASVGFAPSNVTTVVFSAPGASTAPSLSPATGTYNTMVTPVLTNQGAVSEVICYTTDGTIPSCAAGVCGNASTPPGTTTSLVGGLGIAGAGTASVTGFTLTAGGSGYTSAPTVSLGLPGGTGTQASATATIGFPVASITLPALPITGCGPTPTVHFSGGGTAAATATVDATGTITGITVTAGGSYTTAPTVTIAAGGCGLGAVSAGTAVLATTGSVTGVTLATGGSGYTAAPTVSFSGGGGTGAAATAVIGAITTATAPLPVVEAALGLTTNPTVINVVACNTGAAESPVVTATYTSALAAPTVVDTTQSTATTTVSVVNGSTLPIGDTIQLGTSSNFTSGTLSICYTTDGTVPACATCVNSAAVTAQASGPFAGGFATGPIVTAVNTFAAGTNTLKAITCSTGTETASTVYSAALNLTAQTPVATPVGGTYFSNQTVTLASTTGATICYTTDGATPSCTAGACTGGSSQYGVGIPVNATGTSIKAVACSSALTSAQSATNTYVLDVGPIVLNPATPATCPSTATIGFDCAAGSPCSTATNAADGPTGAIGANDPVICYSTDGTAVTACGALGTTGSITCFDTVLHPTENITLNTTHTVHALGCLTGTGIAFNNTAATLPITFTPFTDPGITVDGVLTDWDVAPVAGETVSGTAAGTGYFTYTASTLYFGLSGAYTHFGTTYAGVYIGNGAATGGATVGLPALGGAADQIPLAAGILYAFQWPTDGSAAPTAYAWNAGLAAWAAATFTPTVGYAGPTSTTPDQAEFSVPLSSLPALGSTTITAIESVVTTAPASPTTAVTFPGSTPLGAAAGVAYAHYFDVTLASCQSPDTQTH
jgi:hypothetical protein